MSVILLFALPILLAVTLHEVAHGYAARALGDRTPEAFGRLSLNPMRHVDPLGTVLVPAVTWLLAGFAFGWAKPVPIAALLLKPRDMVLIALAGPAANLAMALAWGCLLALDPPPSTALMALVGVKVNLLLALLNLLPIPPLDGAQVVAWAFPRARIERFAPLGFAVVVLAVAAGWLRAPAALLEAGLQRLLGVAA